MLTLLVLSTVQKKIPTRQDKTDKKDGWKIVSEKKGKKKMVTACRYTVQQSSQWNA